ncbi:MAG: MarR family transcriptional regulator [Ignavibacteriae bacterium]|nr:MarR family transcriptional regulator [Ignavibacteriota bacterium]
MPKTKINGELGFLLNKGTQALHKETNRKFNASNIDITFEQGTILFFLSHCSAKSQNEIAEKTYKDKVSIKKLIDNLEKRGLVYRSSDEKDKRVKNVHLTEKGEALIPKLKKISQEALNVGFSSVSSKNLEVFKSVLSEIVKNFTGEDLLKFIKTNKIRWK